MGRVHTHGLRGRRREGDEGGREGERERERKIRLRDGGEKRWGENILRDG